MCASLPSEEARALAPAIQDHARAIRMAQEDNEFLDAETAEQIALALAALFMDYDSYNDHQKRLVVGAARYFIQSQDAEGDLTSILGCEDDAQVLNYVAEQLDRKDLRVAL
jgi:uncharacterized membrane protein YkvA (DUF1232 family)